MKNIEAAKELLENVSRVSKEAIKKLNDSGLAVIMISHDITRVASEAKHILSLGENAFFFGSEYEYREHIKGEI